jgi:hypothetical protein
MLRCSGYVHMLCYLLTKVAAFEWNLGGLRHQLYCHCSYFKHNRKPYYNDDKSKTFTLAISDCLQQLHLVNNNSTPQIPLLKLHSTLAISDCIQQRLHLRFALEAHCCGSSSCRNRCCILQLGGGGAAFPGLWGLSPSQPPRAPPSPPFAPPALRLCRPRPPPAPPAACFASACSAALGLWLLRSACSAALLRLPRPPLVEAAWPHARSPRPSPLLKTKGGGQPASIWSRSAGAAGPSLGMRCAMVQGLRLPRASKLD